MPGIVLALPDKERLGFSLQGARLFLGSVREQRRSSGAGPGSAGQDTGGRSFDCFGRPLAHVAE